MGLGADVLCITCTVAKKYEEYFSTQIVYGYNKYIMNMYVSTLETRILPFSIKINYDFMSCQHTPFR